MPQTDERKTIKIWTGPPGTGQTPVDSDTPLERAVSRLKRVFDRLPIGAEPPASRAERPNTGLLVRFWISLLVVVLSVPLLLYFGLRRLIPSRARVSAFLYGMGRVLDITPDLSAEPASPAPDVAESLGRTEVDMTSSWIAACDRVLLGARPLPVQPAE